MTDIMEKKRAVNDLRKAGNFEEALPLYRELWEETRDKFDGAGLLHCLRRMKSFNEAIILADELIVKYPDFEWCRKEVIWTYIQGTLDKLDKEEPLEKVVEVANRIMALNPENLAKKMTVYKVLKSAKNSNHWETINEWVLKIDPDSLSSKPMVNESGREGWSDQSLWYNYRIRGLIEKGDSKEALHVVDEILDRFPKQRRIFMRLKGLANWRLGKLSESEEIYQALCGGYRAEWWMVHEYAKVERDSGRKEDSLKLMYKAASSHSKLESMVSLFADIGMLCKEMKKYDEARAHLILCKYIRNEKGWTVPDSITDTVSNLNEILGDGNEPASVKEAMNICQSEWGKVLGKEQDSNRLSHKTRKVKKDLVGKVGLGPSERPYCFIIAKDRQSFFCYKSDLPPGIKDGDKVAFDAIPSFDKKKNRESWKASNIRHY